MVQQGSHWEGEFGARVGKDGIKKNWRLGHSYSILEGKADDPTEEREVEDCYLG